MNKTDHLRLNSAVFVPLFGTEHIGVEFRTDVPR